jgi:hypothetical protein
MSVTQPTWDEEKLKRRYRRTTKILLLLAIIYALWIAIFIIGTYFLGLGSTWAVLSMDIWILSSIVLFAVFIGLELLFLSHYTASKRKHTQKEKPQMLYLKGKRVHNYTLPFSAKGGIFSKTYIMIDEGSVLSLRYQMIPPNDLWGKKQ